MLSIENLVVRYGEIEALRGVSLEVRAGETVALVGANGAGKTSLLRAVSGLARPAAGAVRFADEAIHGLAAEEIVRRGLVHLPEGRAVLATLTVRENLALGAYLRRDAAGIRRDLDEVLARFPALAARLGQRAGSLSGGEQRMLGLSRALMARPRLLMLDEPSLALAPRLVAEVFRVLQALRTDGRTILLVEQNARQALRCADRAYVLEAGSIALDGPAAGLLQDPRVQAAYLGEWSA
ncbi:MAG TPA: ABC transporter ATP-binding protein [Candidatus Methylomirabilis sp.]|jgi:branched-chain amino acid transport system ATP-binding protein